ncbi:PPOX class F420-dependent oxidoreductase [Nocardia sp. A7]|uniref:PPOX class F420-dependent oxidoreductase n=1 Tax=Nocardia sp. A7 TaxID=2789274 RepID=UPI00397B7267
MTNALAAVRNARNVLLSTFRKDGTPVGTPVWAVAEGDKLYTVTFLGSWKVKRLRRDPAVTLQPCSLRGKPHGAVVRGTGRLLDADQTEWVRTLVKKKYPVVGRLIIVDSDRRLGKDGMIDIEITLSE